MRSLKRVQEKLGGYAAVNKKALDQYTSFKDQREELHRRHAEILESGGATPAVVVRVVVAQGWGPEGVQWSVLESGGRRQAWFV
jgi:hypothetical protein